MALFVDSGEEQFPVDGQQAVVLGFVPGVGRRCLDGPDVAAPLPVAHGREFLSYSGAVHEPTANTAAPLATAVVLNAGGATPRPAPPSESTGNYRKKSRTTQGMNFTQSTLYRDVC